MLKNILFNLNTFLEKTLPMNHSRVETFKSRGNCFDNDLHIFNFRLSYTDSNTQIFAFKLILGLLRKNFYVEIYKWINTFHKSILTCNWVKLTLNSRCFENYLLFYFEILFSLYLSDIECVRYHLNAFGRFMI